MVSVSRLTRLLFAAVAVPALAGCAALGLPQLPETSVTPFGASLVDGSPQPGASLPSGADVASADGYSLTLPAGWVSSDLTSTDALSVADTLRGLDPALGAIARTALEQSGARLSLAAVDAVAAASSDDAPAVIIATLRTKGLDKAYARTMVESLLAQAPLAADTTVAHSVQGLPAGDAHRYDAVIQGDTVAVELQVYVFRVGGYSFVVGAEAPVDQFPASQAAFDAIVKSLRFGV